MSANGTQIFSRMTACGCGCKGRDSHHRQSFSRQLQDTRPASGTARVRVLGSPSAQPIVAEAVAQLPWGKTRVVEVAEFGGLRTRWMVDYDDMISVMNGATR